MAASSAYLVVPAGEALHQGEILSGLLEERPSPRRGGDFDVEVAEHPLAFVLSQDCDLDWDFHQRFPSEPSAPVQGKDLPSILFCEVILYSELRSTPGMDPGVWKRAQSNREDRWQFLSRVSVASDSRGAGIAAMAIDFKRYFTLRTSRVYSQLGDGIVVRRSRLVSPYREQVAQRFGNFLTRIALPLDHGPLEASGGSP